MLKGKGRLIYTPDGKVSVYIPTSVHRDSAWPFKKENQDVDVELIIDLHLDGKCLIIKSKKEVK
ncbi:hypothetical protein ES703_02145 [subsurface metagenome]